VVAVRLGLLHQEAGRFRAARMYYRRSIPSDPGDPLPWIGLADIDYARGRYETASGLYRRVLDRLSREKDRPGLKELRSQEHGIRLRYERARIKAGVHFDSLRRLVSVNRILEALVPPATEHSNNASPLHERVAMNIAFEVDAPRLLPRGREQLERVALAFNSPALSGSDFLIEGHSDTLGDSYNNLYLSLLRARAVRDFLVEKGVDRQRLRVIGVGSARPLADSDNQQDQGINRRVEFVNLQR
jgi:outer membrane protein OmpA-like peptidoglycan-associated protein